MISQNYSCDYCKSNEYEVIFQGPDLLEDLPGVFQWVKCKQCGLLRQNPRPDWDTLQLYYPAGYVCHDKKLAEKQNGVRTFLRHLGPQKRIRLVHKYKACGRWLDVGCGGGTILQEAQRQGHWELQGLEPVPDMARYTAEQLNIPVFSGQLEDYDAPAGSFDVITLWDVLEHLPNPVQSMRKIQKLLAKNGLFVFSTPNMNSLDLKVFGKAWLGYDLPRHLYLFPEEVLDQLLSESGFSILQKLCFSGSHGAWYLDFRYWKKANPGKKIANLFPKSANSPLFRALSFLPLRLIDALKLGTSICYVVRKND